MSIDFKELNSLEPQAFLDKILQTPYPRSEKIQDIKSGVFCFLNGVSCSIHSFFKVPKMWWDYYFPTYDKSHPLNDRAISLMSEWAKKQGYDSSQVESNLRYIIEKSNEIAKKMGIQTVEIYLNKNITVLDAKQISNRIILQIGKHCLLMTKESIDFSLAGAFVRSSYRFIQQPRYQTTLLVIHALSQFIYYSRSKSWVDHIRFFSWCALVIGAVESLVYPYFASALQMEFDKEIMDLFQSNKVLVAYFHQHLKRLYRDKHTSIEELQKLHPNMNRESISRHKNCITPQGNLRALGAPSTQRLAQALKYQSSPMPASSPVVVKA